MVLLTTIRTETIPSDYNAYNLLDMYDAFFEMTMINFFRGKSIWM